MFFTGYLAKNKVFNYNSCHTYLRWGFLPPFFDFNLVTYLHVCLCLYVIQRNRIGQYWHITFVICKFLLILFMSFTFDTACRVFLIMIRDVGSPPSGRDGKFSWFFYWAVGIIKCWSWSDLWAIKLSYCLTV